MGSFGFGKSFYGYFFKAAVEIVYFIHAFFFGNDAAEVAHDFGTGIGQRINGVTESVDQTAVVLEFLLQDFMYDIFHLGIGRLDTDGIDNAFHHDGYFDIGTAVTGPLEGCDRSGHGRIDVRIGRRHDEIGKGRVGAAAVIGMEKEEDIEEMRFFFSKSAVQAEHGKDILGRRVIFTGIVDD